VHWPRKKLRAGEAYTSKCAIETPEINSSTFKQAKREAPVILMGGDNSRCKLPLVYKNAANISYIHKKYMI
jgi:hypothetical protein